MIRSNREIFRRAAVVKHYSELKELQPSERQIFQSFLRPGMRILDVGVGGGRTTPFLASLAGKYVGIDYSPEMIESCRRKFPSLEFHQMDASDLSHFQNGAFDALVFSFNGLDYLSAADRVRCIKECRRLLAEGGVFIFSSHNALATISIPDFSNADPARVAWRLLRSLTISLNSALRNIFGASFWTGEGRLRDAAHGGLDTHAASPKKIVAQLCGFGFEHLRTVNSQYPKERSPFLTPWYYYAFRAR